MNKDSLPPTRQRKTPAERRPWQPEEDKLLLELVEKESRGDEPTMWKRVAESIPGRNNKNCRKRWHSTLKCKNNGTWAPDEDERLINAVKTHGTLWVKVAKHVGTRISDQCAKRWTDYLDPSLTHEEWLAEEDSLLLKAVETHGRSWTLIVQSCLKGRAAISAKNRYGKLMRDIEKANTKNRGKGNAARAKRSARAMETVTELEDFGVATSLPPEPMSVDINLGDPLKKRQRTCSASSSPSTVATTADSAFSASSTTGSVGYSPIVDTGFQDFLNRPLPQFPAADPASMDIDDFFFLHGSKIGLAPLPASPILGDMDGFDSFDPFCVTDSPAPLAQTYLSSALDPVAVPSSYDEFGFLSSEMFGDVLSTAAWAEPGSNVHEHTAFLETFLTEQGLPRASQSMLGDELFHMEPAAFPIPPQPPSPAPAVVKDPASVKFLRTTPMRPFQPVGSIPPAPKLPNGGVTTPQAQVQPAQRRVNGTTSLPPTTSASCSASSSFVRPYPLSRRCVSSNFFQSSSSHAPTPAADPFGRSYSTSSLRLGYMFAAHHVAPPPSRDDLGFPLATFSQIQALWAELMTLSIVWVLLLTLAD